MNPVLYIRPNLIRKKANFAEISLKLILAYYIMKKTSDKSHIVQLSPNSTKLF